VKSRVGSLYGLTEAGGVLAAGSGADVADRPGCVGRALPVVELRIAQPDGEGIGEIQARTPTSTGGYLGDAESIGDADGWIRTGDLGRIDHGGRLYVTGRSKDVIIRGGENVGAVHVEDRLLRHPDVLEAAVVALPDPDLGEAVAAAVVLRPGAEWPSPTWRRTPGRGWPGSRSRRSGGSAPRPCPSTPAERCSGARCSGSGESSAAPPWTSERPIRHGDRASTGG
jgi:long-chain acyl-CoA synthetase